jgi:carbon storage regulator CsrA
MATERSTLVLTRKLGQAVMIGTTRVVVLGFEGEGDEARVKLGFEAERTIRIDREEIAAARKAEAARDMEHGARRHAEG